MSNDPRTIPELLTWRVEATPDEPFLISEADGRRFTYAEFDAAVNRAATMLSSHGIGKGEAVSLLLPNSAEYVVAYFACWRLGAVAGPINSLLKTQEISYVISNSEAKALLVNSEYLPLVDDTRTKLTTLRAVIPFDSEAEATRKLGGVKDSLLPSLSEINSDDEAIIIYTSGTTGKPKGCLLTHGNVLANAKQISEWLGFNQKDRLLSVMPLFHMNAVSVTTMAALYAGGSTVVTPKFSASRFWQIISDYQITSFGSVATMLSMLLSTYPKGMPEGLRTTFRCLVIEGYGLSESTCRSTFNPPDDRRRPGSCGLPIGNDMSVVDEEDREVKDGTLGEIVLRGDNVLKGYYKNPDATATAFRHGWFHTGDIGYRDGDGFYYIVDRKSDMIIRGGENIYPREIDEVLYQHTAVAAAAVVGVPDNLYGEEVAAFVVLKEGVDASEEQLIEFCKARLADYKCPKTVRFVKDIPKGPTGKLLKRELVNLERDEGLPSGSGHGALK